MTRFSKFFGGLTALFSDNSTAAAKRKRRNKTTKKRSLRMESLETRELMARDISVSFDYADRILRIEGTDAADVIQLNNFDGAISVSGRSITVRNGASVTTAASLNRSLMNSAQVDLLGGNDTFRVVESTATQNSPSFQLPMIITGQSGDDIIYGGSARDLIYGGLGADWIFAGKGNDYVEGGYNNYNAKAKDLDALNGFYAPENLKQNTLGKGEKWFKDSKNQNYYVMPWGEVFRAPTFGVAGSSIATLDASYHADIFALVNAADVFGTKDLTAMQASYFDTTLGLRATDNLSQNSLGKNEKWLLDKNNVWYYIEPMGQLYQKPPFDPTKKAVDGASGTLVAVLSPAYYVDISKLVDAQNIYLTSGDNDKDTVFGGFGDDEIRGFSGNDTLVGDQNLDKLWGGDGNDTLFGAAIKCDYATYTDANNYLWGEEGNDNLYGGNGFDDLRGGNGNDGLVGGGGTNHFRGEGGVDRFINWGSETNTFVDRDSQDVTIRLLNSASGVYAPPTNWPKTQTYNFSAGAWTAREIFAADTAFGILHSVTNNTKLLKTPTGNEFTFTRRGQQTSGDWDFGGQNDGKGNVTIGQVRNATLDLQTLQQTIYHEVGHGWGDTSTTVNPFFNQFLAISNWRITAPPPPATTAFAVFMSLNLPSGANDDSWWYSSSAVFARDTASLYRDYSRLSPWEDYATTWETYFMDLYHGSTLGNQRVQAKYDNVTLLLNRLRTV